MSYVQKNKLLLLGIAVIVFVLVFARMPTTTATQGQTGGGMQICYVSGNCDNLQSPLQPLAITTLTISDSRGEISSFKPFVDVQTNLAGAFTLEYMFTAYVVNPANSRNNITIAARTATQTLTLQANQLSRLAQETYLASEVEAKMDSLALTTADFVVVWSVQLKDKNVSPVGGVLTVKQLTKLVFEAQAGLSGSTSTTASTVQPSGIPQPPTPTPQPILSKSETSTSYDAIQGCIYDIPAKTVQKGTRVTIVAGTAYGQQGTIDQPTTNQGWWITLDSGRYDGWQPSEFILASQQLPKVKDPTSFYPKFPLNSVGSVNRQEVFELDPCLLGTYIVTAGVDKGYTATPFGTVNGVIILNAKVNMFTPNEVDRIAPP